MCIYRDSMMSDKIDCYTMCPVCHLCNKDDGVTAQILTLAKQSVDLLEKLYEKEDLKLGL